MINRAFNFTETEGAKEFTDVDYNGKFGNDLKIASAMGYLSGYGDTAGPGDSLSREMAFTILARIYVMEGGAEGKTRFSDDADISGWARGSMNAMTGAGYVSGMGDGTLQPKSALTKGQAAQILANLFGTVADKNVSEDATYRSLTVRKPGVTVKNAAVEGDLFITDGVGKDNADFENVTVKGRTLVTGGGSVSVSFRNSAIDELIISGRWNTHVKLNGTALTGLTFTASDKVSVSNAAITFDADTGKLTLAGTFGKIVENGDKTVTVTVGGATFVIRFAPSSLFKSLVKPAAPSGGSGGGGYTPPTYTITHSVPGDAHASPGATVGYGTQTPLTVTVTNTGSGGLTGGTIALTSGANFDVNKNALSAISSGGTDTFTVTPKTGLADGTYTDTVTVTGTPGGETAVFTVSFTVLPVSVTGVTMSPTTCILTKAGATLSASVQPASATNQNVAWSSSAPAL